MNIYVYTSLSVQNTDTSQSDTNRGTRGLHGSVRAHSGGAHVLFVVLERQGRN